VSSKSSCAPIELQIFELKDFRRSLIDLRSRGGIHDRAAAAVYEIIGAMNVEGPAALDRGLTKHGESRIKRCFKYDLTGGAHRLVTIRHDNALFLCLAADHKDTDRWLDRNRGLVPSRDNKGHLTLVHRTVDVATPGSRVAAQSDLVDRVLLDRLDRSRHDELLEGLPPGLIGRLFHLDTTATEEQLSAVCREIADAEKGRLIYDVLAALLGGDVDRAVRRMGIARGSIVPISELPVEELGNLIEGTEIRRVPIESEEFNAWLDRFAKSAVHLDWLMFMHPEQEEVVNADFDGPAKLAGVSGAGKTCIAVQRAVRLARAGAAEVLVLTLNRSLASLIDSLVDHACDAPEIRVRIQVLSFFDLCQQLLAEIEPENRRLYVNVTWKEGDHVDEVFREYYRCELNNRDAEVLLPVHRSLNARRVFAEDYLRQEFDWIRAALRMSERTRYPELERRGRKLPLLEDQRRQVMRGLAGWERKMRDVGVIDYLGLTTALDRHLERITPKRMHLLVDEVQDFGTTELRLLRRLVTPGPNDIFLCGDVAQHILPKSQSFAEAGIEVARRQRTIKRNYRNSREILEAAYDMLYANLDEETFKGELEILDPDFASRSTPMPLALEAGRLEEEIGFALTYLQHGAEEADGHSACLAFAGFSFLEVERFGRKHELPVLDGSHRHSGSRLCVSDLEQMKGYEFDKVVIVNLNDDVMPPRHMPPEEAYRHACLLYVAMTRAKLGLALSYSGQPSRWLVAIRDRLTWLRWDESEILDPKQLRGVPEPLPEGVHEHHHLWAMSGRQFLYTRDALGLSIEAQQKLDELVDGRGLMRAGAPVRWRNLSDLAGSMARSGHALAAFGPVTGREVRELLDRLFPEGPHRRPA
jgi:hypothetical protein